MKLLLTGATGFVGREVLKQAVKSGHRVRILVRDLQKAKNGVPEPEVELFNGDILDEPSLAGCMEGIDVVIHLVGIITESNEMTFDRVHYQGTLHLLAEAKKSKVKRWIQMSALGARPKARSRYHQSKWAAEQAVRASELDWTIMRPSIIYGPGDKFVNLFAQMMKFPRNLLQLYTIPLMGGGYSFLQPIPVEDVAKSFIRALDQPESIRKSYDLCGPEPLRLRQILEEIALVIGTKPLLVPIPWSVAKAMAWLMETWMKHPPLNRDQVLMLEEDNVGDPAPAMKDFGIQPPSFREGIGKYLKK